MDKFHQLDFGVINRAVLDQRLGLVGASGSGKTYGAGGLVEKLLEKKEPRVEVKANDPRVLRARIAELERAAKAGKPASNPVEKIDMASIKAARSEGYAAGLAKGTETAIRDLAKAASQARRSAQDALSSVEALTLRISASASRIAPAAPASPVPSAAPAQRPAVTPKPARTTEGVERPMQRVLDALAWWRALGIEEPMQAQVAFIAGYSYKSGTWSTYLSRLRSLELINRGGDLKAQDWLFP